MPGRTPIFLRILAFGAITGLLVSAWFGYKWHQTTLPVIPPTEILRAGDIRSLIRATGLVKPIEEVEVGTQATGQLRSLVVAVGDQVKRGQLLGEIDPQLARNDVVKAEAQRDEGIAQISASMLQLALFKKQHRRAEIMRATDALAQAEVEKAQTAFQRQQQEVKERSAALRRANIDLDSARTRLEQTRIIAPISGQVMEVKIKQGQTVVAAQTAQVVLILADLTKMTVQAHVSEADIHGIAAGQSVIFSVIAEPTRRMKAILRAVEPAPVKFPGDSSQAIYYNALFDVNNESGVLRSMMTADVTIVRERADHVLTVPLTALIAGAEAKTAIGSARSPAPSPSMSPTPDAVARDTARVWLVERLVKGEADAAPTPTLRDIVLGIRGDLRVEVVSGLVAGELVVIDAADLPAPGDTSIGTSAAPPL